MNTRTSFGRRGFWHGVRASMPLSPDIRAEDYPPPAPMASTGGRCPGQDGDPRVLVLINFTALSAIF